MNIIKLLCIVLLLIGFSNLHAQRETKKARVIAMTDGEIDDQSSMIRFLLYTCDIELLAIIETNSRFQRNGHSDEDWYENQLKAYREIYSKLIIHNPDYPSYEKLKSLSFIGDEDIKHLDGMDKNELHPGGKVMIQPKKWEDSPGSDRIVEVLLEENPDPVFIQAWGGGNTAARAFCKLQTEYPDDYDRAVAKVVMYNIWYQDGAGTYIEQNHPEVTMLHCNGFSGSWDYNSQKNTFDYIKENVKNNHGPLGSLYPQDYVSEGDSPSFLYSIANGLRNHEDPGYGGWGGRFTRVEQFKNVYEDANDNGDIRSSLRMWVKDANNDFEARMDWCVQPEYSGANHPPMATVKGEKDLSVRSEKKVKLNATKSFDPDGDEMLFKWFQYKEAGSCNGIVEILNSDQSVAEFIAPVVSKPETIHIILRVQDNGSPTLSAYQRIIVTVIP